MDIPVFFKMRSNLIYLFRAISQHPWHDRCASWGKRAFVIHNNKQSKNTLDGYYNILGFKNVPIFFMSCKGISFPS